jgi:hypothetical protein
MTVLNHISHPSTGRSYRRRTTTATSYVNCTRPNNGIRSGPGPSMIRTGCSRACIAAAASAGISRRGLGLAPVRQHEVAAALAALRMSFGFLRSRTPREPQRVRPTSAHGGRVNDLPGVRRPQELPLTKPRRPQSQGRNLLLLRACSAVARRNAFDYRRCAPASLHGPPHAAHFNSNLNKDGTHCGDAIAESRAAHGCGK